MTTENQKIGKCTKNLVMFLMLLSILLIPSIFFITKSYTQLESILLEINKPISLKTPVLLDENSNEIIKVMYEPMARVALEHDVMAYRHQRTTAFLATRTWMRFMRARRCFKWVA